MATAGSFKRTAGRFGRLALAAGAALCAFAARPAAASAACEDLRVQLPTHTAPETIERIPAGGWPSASGKAVGDMPAFCRVKGVISPVEGSRIGFELWLPETGWNGRLLMIGNGGYSSAIAYPLLAAHVRRGYAALATDTGHTGDDPDFVVGHPEALIDWGHRAVHETAVAGKAMVASYYGASAQHAYFQGCSTGGHQALMEAQRYPDDFDGIIAGAPGSNRTHLNAAFLWQYVQNHPRGGDGRPILTPDTLTLVSRAAFEACRNQNGKAAGGLAGDAYLNDPLACRFDPAVLACKDAGPDANQAACLTATQVAALRRMYQGATNPRTGERIDFGWPIGSEAGWSWYWADPAKPTQPARVNFWRDWAFGDPTWSWWSFDFDRDMTAADDKLAQAINAMDPDLERFRRRGGKLIQYHGLADPVSPVLDSVSYRQRVVDDQRRRHGGREATSDFYRLFLAPGVGHCMGGPGPQPVELQAAIEAWVEQGRAPDRLLAIKPAQPDGEAGFSRPLCPYPEVARFDGAGPPEEAASFRCVAPQMTPKVQQPAPAYLR